MEKVNLLVTLDRAYLNPLTTMLYSLFENGTADGEEYQVFLLHQGDFTAAEIDSVNTLCQAYHSQLYPVEVKGRNFLRAKNDVERMPALLYYRMLAHKFLPDSIDRVLYLDPDLLVLNPIRPLYATDLNGQLFGASLHSTEWTSETQDGMFKSSTGGYYNSGVLLMNLEKMRNEIEERVVANYLEANRTNLTLPDHDILNGLFSDQIQPLDPLVFNLDVAAYENYFNLTKPTEGLDHLMRHGCIFHFLGNNKPWQPDYEGMFALLYKHYEIRQEKKLLQLLSV